MTWLRVYALACGLAVVATAGVLALLIAWDVIPLKGHGAVALILGASLSVALAALLMGLLFASHRSEHDQAVHDADPLQRRDRR